MRLPGARYAALHRMSHAFAHFFLSSFPTHPRLLGCYSDNPSKRYLEEHPSQSGGLVRTIHVWCSVMSLDGTVDKHATHTGTVDASDADGCGLDQALVKARQIGEELGDMLLKKGADKLLEGIVDKEGPGHRAPSAAASSK